MVKPVIQVRFREKRQPPFDFNLSRATFLTYEKPLRIALSKQSLTLPPHLLHVLKKWAGSVAQSRAFLSA